MIPTSSVWHLKSVLVLLVPCSTLRILTAYLQLEDEISALFDFMQHIYGLFGFDFHLELSTRPDNYLGAVETWNQAEDASPAFPLFCD